LLKRGRLCSDHAISKTKRGWKKFHRGKNKTYCGGFYCVGGGIFLEKDILYIKG
jgi:hypothetical protein